MPLDHKRAAELRAEFDESFRLEPSTERDGVASVLLVRVSGETFGLRLSQVNGVVKDKKVTPLPGSAPALLGIAGFRGSLAAVYELAWLLERPVGQPGRWLALVASEREPLALAFEALQGQIPMFPGSLIGMPSGRHTEGLLPWGERHVPLLSVPSLLAELGGS